MASITARTASAGGWRLSSASVIPRIREEKKRPLSGGTGSVVQTGRGLFFNFGPLLFGHGVLDVLIDEFLAVFFLGLGRVALENVELS